MSLLDATCWKQATGVIFEQRRAGTNSIASSALALWSTCGGQGLAVADAAFKAGRDRDEKAAERLQPALEASEVQASLRRAEQRAEARSGEAYLRRLAEHAARNETPSFRRQWRPPRPRKGRPRRQLRRQRPAAPPHRLHLPHGPHRPHSSLRRQKQRARRRPPTRESQEPPGAAPADSQGARR